MHTLDYWGSAHMSRILILATFCITHSQAEVYEDIFAEYYSEIRSDDVIKKVAENKYNYDHQGQDWEGICQLGLSQSPIKLAYAKSIIRNVLPIRFHNYNEKLQSSLVITNNGHTASMVLPPTHNGRRAYINGGFLQGNFEAHRVHFHWGSSVSKGSEHTIDSKRYDVEMHIVHKNIRYAHKSVAEASGFANGIVVLGVMFQTGPDTVTKHSGLLSIFNQLPRIIKYQTNTTVDGPLTTGQLLGNITTDAFYSYNGSLTTPDCAETVTWTVFDDVVYLPRQQIRKLWDLMDYRNRPLINNYREIQSTNNRPLYHTVKKVGQEHSNIKQGN